MSNRTYLGRNMQRFTSAPQFNGYSKVIITVGDDIEYSAGNDTGRTLRVTNPWATPQMAQDILNDIRGFQYQPYTAENALIDPAAELGDGVTANNVYGGIYTQKISFGRLLTATVSAPEDEELNHEYPYQSKPNREITRETKQIRATLRVQADMIAAEVEERKSDVQTLTAKLQVQADRITQEVTDRKSAVEILTAQLQVQAGLIEAKVSKTGGSSSSFGWALTDSSWTLTSNGSTVLKATSSGIEVSGKITATSGKIGGFDIKSNYLSYNNQAWGGTNSTGIYIGISGIQCGAAETGIQLTNNGYLYAEHGEFRGSVRAGKIQYGGSNGTLNGAGITGGSISGNRLVGNTITTAQTSGGINTSLANADYAYGAVNGWYDIYSWYTNTLHTKYLYLNGTNINLKSISFEDYDGATRTIHYLGW